MLGALLLYVLFKDCPAVSSTVRHLKNSQLGDLARPADSRPLIFNTPLYVGAVDSFIKP
jgi:hypothetical protein